MAIDEVLISAPNDQLHSIEQREQHTHISCLLRHDLMCFASMLGNLQHICSLLSDACCRLPGFIDRTMFSQNISPLAQYLASGQEASVARCRR